MKTLQDQYNLIKEGKGNKEIFLKQAKSLFPQYVTNASTFKETTTILKQKGILSEAAGGVVTTGTTPDWFSIFNKSLTENDITEYGTSDYIEDFEEAKKYAQAMSEKHGVVQHVNEVPSGGYKVSDWYDSDTTLASYENGLPLNENKEKRKLSLNEAKAIEKKTTKEVTDMETRGYDYKTLDNIDNVYGQEFLLGYLVEIGDVKNSDKSIDELKAIITKNLSKDRLHYVKKGQFGIKDLGYTDEHPGLGKSKEPKGKYKSSGYGDLESENFEPEKPKSNTKDLGEKENKTGMPRKIDLMSMVPKSSKGIKKMPMPGKEKKIKLQETEMNHIQEQKLRNIITKLIVEAINQKEIDAAGEEASVKAKTKLIDKEINKRKKKLKALTTLKELEADSVNPKKIKELSDDIKKLEKLKDKLNKKPSKKAPQQEEPLNERSKEEIAAATAEIDAEIKNKETQKKAIDKSIQALKKAQGTTKSEQPTDAA
jgi:hypothetical protein